MVLTTTAVTQTSLASVTTMSANFTTGSGTYVDVTGVTLSVANKSFYSIRIDFDGDTGNGQCQFLEGATVKYTTAAVTTRTVENSGVFQNVTGSAATCKLQAKVASGNTCTVYQGAGTAADKGTVEAMARFSLTSFLTKVALEPLPIDASITSIDLLCLDAKAIYGMGVATNGNELTFRNLTINGKANGFIFYDDTTETTEALWDFTGVTWTLA